MKNNYTQLMGMLFLSMLSMGAMAQLSTPPGGGNQKSVVRQYIGNVPYVEVVYNSPDITGPNGQSRKGQIWGQLVPYGFTSQGFGLSTPDNPSPWRAGANQNTTIEFSHDMLVEGKEIKAGKYGFHIAPAEEGPWTLIFSKDNNHWGSFFYTEENDALRVEVETAETEFTEWLTYDFIDRQPNSTMLALKWDELSVPFRIEVPNNTAIHIAKIQEELNNNLGFTWTNFQGAANYAMGAGELEKALEWADQAISAPFVGQKNFATMQTKANVLNAMGKSDESLGIMAEAVELPGATAFALHAYGRQLIAADQKDEALAIFKKNHKRNNGIWPTNYGLARGYSALGNYKQALKYMELAKANVPPGDTLNPPVIDQNIEKLKKGEDIN